MQADDVFRKLLKELRLAKNLTQTELAVRLGQPQSYVSKYETGERRLDFVETAFLCDVLGMSMEEFTTVFTNRLTKVRRVKAEGPKGGTR